MEKKIISTSNAPQAIGPYSQAIMANGFIYVSGQIPFTPDGKLVADDIKSQTEQSLTNLSEILKEAGSNLEKVVKVNIFLKDMNDFAVVNDIYAKYFTSNYPARAAVEVARLPKDVLVEIECVALA
ncbi:MAG: RidA family protein [Planctomycetes bacterium]|nr:RidA family protein [Planctomycetota bacterium]